MSAFRRFEEEWRHFYMLDPTQGGSGGGDSGDSGALNDPFNWPSPPPDDTTPPLPSSYPTGPPQQQNYYHRSSGNSAPSPPDPWKDVPPRVHEQAIALVEQFMQAAGWPTYVDTNQAALGLSKSGLNLTASPFDAFDWLFNNSISGAYRDNNPWARFGMGKDEYNQTAGKLHAVFFDWTGDTMNAQILTQAIRGAWTPDEIRNWAMFGNASGAGPMLESAKFTGDMPWLSSGQTYTQVLEQFQSFEETTPADKATLAAFWRFGQSAKQLGTAREAAMTTSRQSAAGISEIR